MTIAIYQIRNTETNLLYLGSSINAEQRWKTHRGELRRGAHPNARLQADWSEYGEAVFVFEIVEVVSDRSFITEREMAWLDKLRSDAGVRLYNMKERPVRVSVGPRSTRVFRTTGTAELSPEAQRYQDRKHQERQGKIETWKQQR